MKLAGPASHLHLGGEDKMALWEVLDKKKEKCAEAARGDCNFFVEKDTLLIVKGVTVNSPAGDTDVHWDCPYGHQRGYFACGSYLTLLSFTLQDAHVVMDSAF